MKNPTQIPEAPERLTFHLKDLLQEKDAYFDLLLCIDVFEHVENPFQFLRDLKKYAMFKVFHIPLDLSVQGVLRRGRLLKDFREVGHRHYYNRELALEILRETGYEIVDWNFTTSALSLKSASYLRYAARVPRALLYKASPDLAARTLGGFSLLVLAR